MTTNNIISDDGQLQVESLKAVLSKDGIQLDKAGVVLVADVEANIALHGTAGCNVGTWGSVLWPMVGGALAELLRRAKAHDADAWAVIVQYFVLAHEDDEEPKVKAVGVKVKDFGALLAALGGKEVVSDEQ